MKDNDNRAINTVANEPDTSNLIDLKSAIEEKLSESSHLEIRRIRIAVDERGVVTLHGRVKSFYMRQVAVHLAGSVDGTDCVRDELVVPREHR